MFEDFAKTLRHSGHRFAGHTWHAERHTRTVHGRYGHDRTEAKVVLFKDGERYTTLGGKRALDTNYVVVVDNPHSWNGEGFFVEGLRTKALNTVRGLNAYSVPILAEDVS